jgi:hypothetical protein
MTARSALDRTAHETGGLAHPGAGEYGRRRKSRLEPGKLKSRIFRRSIEARHDATRRDVTRRPLREWTP